MRLPVDQSLDLPVEPPDVSSKTLAHPAVDSELDQRAHTSVRPEDVIHLPTFFAFHILQR